MNFIFYVSGPSISIVHIQYVSPAESPVVCVYQRISSHLPESALVPIFMLLVMNTSRDRALA